MLMFEVQSVQNGVLRRYIQEWMSTHPEKQEDPASDLNFTLVVLYMAVTEMNGGITNGGQSYAQGKWSSFVAKVMG